MKPITELTDLEAEQRLTELLGDCWHELEKYPSNEARNFNWCPKCKTCPIYRNKPYATSYDDIIPVLQMVVEKYDVAFSAWLKTTPRQLLNAVIEVLESEVGE